jgi:hypothetical protein
MIRRMWRTVGVAVVATATVGFVPALPAAAARSSTVFTMRDPRLTEVSGIARGIRSPGVFYVQNDSGDSARFFAVDAQTGRVRAEYRVPGATNVDWEDIAVAPDAAGVPSVWIGDIGDNNAQRTDVRVYRVDEPRVAMNGYDMHLQTKRPDVWRLRYPNGPVNAESLAVDPAGRGFIFTKAGSGHSICYEVPRRPDAAQTQTLRQVGAIQMHARPSLIVPTDLQRMATGAAISPDGTVLVVRTYTDAYLWHVKHDDIARALRTEPRHLELPLQLQGEGIGFDRDHLVVDSEGDSSQVLEVALPADFRAPDATPPATGVRTSNTPSSSPDASTHPATSPGTPSASPAPSDNRITLSLGWRLLIALGSIALGLVLLARMIARRRQRPPN